MDVPMTMFILFCVFDEISLKMGKSCAIIIGQHQSPAVNSFNCTYVLRTGVCEDLYGEGGHKARGEVYEVDLPRLLGTLQREEVAYDHNYHQICYPCVSQRD